MRTRIESALDTDLNQLPRWQSLESGKQRRCQRAEGFDPVREAPRTTAAIGKAPRFCSASGRGKDSSSRMRTGSQQVSGKFESRDRLFAPHSGEIVDKLIQGVAGGEVVEEILHGHPSSAEDGRAAENRGGAMNDGIQRRHDVDPTPIE